MVLPCNEQDVWYLSSIYDYPRITRERNLEISDRWIGVQQPVGLGAVHRAAVLSRRYSSTTFTTATDFRCNRRAYERWRSAEKGLAQTMGDQILPKGPGGCARK